ncbi:MAG: ATP-binding cassette domain-containing protein [Firmicutes bacterium]|nr:ATP-binding cassette domain-containing protein [Bacillota bacterium]
MAESGEVVLELQGIAKDYPVGHKLFGGKRWLHALSPVDLVVHAGDTIALVGESGCGKSTLGKVLSFVQPASAGAMWVEGKNVYQVPKKEGRALRTSVQIIHQDPYSALNPRKTVQSILMTPMLAHKVCTRKQAAARAAELLETVGLVPAATFLKKYPYELSGGQRQRVVIARSLTVNPKVLVADEAVSMIDVSLRQSILGTLKRLQEELGLAIVFITHDLAIARYFAQGQRTAVMYAGRVVEQGPTEQVIGDPLHPYSAILRTAVPDPDPDMVTTGGLNIVAGEMPDLTTAEVGCRFANRCPFASEVCARERPELQEAGEGRQVACHHPVSWGALDMTAASAGGSAAQSQVVAGR